MPESEHVYVLQTGDQGAARLRRQDAIYGALTRQMMLESGLRPGMRVLDLACGTGIMTHWLKEQVGSSGCVVGMDINRDQLGYARAQGGGPEFLEGNAYATGLPTESFDMVHCRLLLCHLDRPLEALREMHRLLKPGGVLVCQDLDMSSVFCSPASEAYARSVWLAHEMGRRVGINPDFGTVLHRAVVEAGFGKPRVRYIQPVYVHGQEKSWWRDVFAEASVAIVKVGIASQEEIDGLLAELDALVRDESVLVAHARMPAVAVAKA